MLIIRYNIFNPLFIYRLLIAVLLLLVIIATVFDYAKYSELMIWQWNQGIK